jgi:hypothetical protein
VKELLRGMLKVVEAERMSWEDVFSNSLIKDFNLSENKNSMGNNNNAGN